MRYTTLCLLVKTRNGKINEVCLGEKKRGFGAGNYNGAGGKLEEGEDITRAAVRETEEEFSVSPRNLKKCAEIYFHLPHETEWSDIFMQVFITDRWDGEITETEEMSPEWFDISEIPYDKMWEDDRHWLPLVLEGKKIKGKFIFGENHKMANIEYLKEVEKF